MLNKVLLFTLFISVSIAACAQDLIILRSNSNVTAKVLEVGVTEIKYKKFDNPDGPVYSVLKSEVFMIKYENGTTDIFSEPEKTSVQDTSTFIYPYNNKPPTKLMAYAAFSMPVGNFAEAREGPARNGWGVGIFTTAPMKNRPAYFHFQFSFAKHPYTVPFSFSSLTDDFSDNYYLWHLLLGFGLKTKPADFGAYINFLGGANYIAVGGVLGREGYSDALAFSLSTGSGLILGNTLMLGVKYLYSKPVFTDVNNHIAGEKSISCLQLTTGFEF